MGEKGNHQYNNTYGLEMPSIDREKKTPIFPHLYKNNIEKGFLK